VAAAIVSAITSFPVTRRRPQLRWQELGDRSISGGGEEELMMRLLIILYAIYFSTNAMAQSLPPKVGNKPLVQVKPKPPMGCKLVGTVKGTKLWAGDCMPSVSNSATTDSAAPAPLPAQASSTPTSDPK
jgi:hypothetical protein